MKDGYLEFSCAFFTSCITIFVSHPFDTIKVCIIYEYYSK